MNAALHPTVEHSEKTVSTPALQAIPPAPSSRHNQYNRINRPKTYRTSPALGDAIAMAAQRAGVTEASWVRQTLADVIGDEISEKPTPVRSYRAPRSKPTVEVLAISALREVVGEAAGTLRQVAGLDRGRGGTRLDEIDLALDNLIEAAAFLDRAKTRLIREAE